MIYSFPDTAGLERAKTDPDELIYSRSGSNKIFHMLKMTAGLPTSTKYDLYLINVYTLIRNVFTSGVSFEEIEKRVDTDVDLMTTFIGAYGQYKQLTKAVVIFYAPNYRAIPKELLRNVSGQRVELDVLYTKLRNKLPVKLVELTEDPCLRKFVVATRGGTYPHKELLEHIKTIYLGTTMRGSLGGTVIISHCPIDLHIKTWIPNIELLESYTATILNPSQFGRKLSTDVNNLPFNIATHRVFGDEVHLIPLVRGKQKSKLIELVERRSWAIKTESEIMSDIVSNFPEISVSDLTLLKL